jgi:2-dehydropantoate 2-reductase
MHIAVFGSGGVGGYFGGRLVQAGEEVVFIARGAHLQALQTSGLRLESIKGDVHLQKVHAVADPAQVGPVDMVLLAVKSWDVPTAIEAMRPLIGESTGIVPLGNGVEHLTQLLSAFGAGHTLGGLCRISAYIAAPGHIRHVGIDPIVIFGELDNHPTPRLEALRAALERGGVNVSVPDDIEVAMWEKFIFIAASSGLGAVTRVPMGIYRGLPATRPLLEGLIGEIVDVARARKVNLSQDVVQRTLAFIDSLPAGNINSMQRDIMEGRPSELEAQNGAVVRMGVEAQVPTPLNELIYTLLLPQELKARGKI